MFSAIARVEIWAQVQTLKRQAAEQGVLLQVEKLDVTDAGHQRKALAWDVNTLVNNARVGEGGATVGIPAANMRRQFEINVIGPLLLTQGVTKQMAQRGEGRIAWVSSREGLSDIPSSTRSGSRHYDWSATVRWLWSPAPAPVVAEYNRCICGWR